MWSGHLQGRHNHSHTMKVVILLFTFSLFDVSSVTMDKNVKKKVVGLHGMGLGGVAGVLVRDRHRQRDKKTQRGTVGQERQRERGRKTNRGKLVFSMSGSGE